MNRYHVWIYLSIIILLRSVDAACTLPAAIQNSRWNDKTWSLLLTFDISSMAGWPVNARGEVLEDYDCISNTDNVYVLKSVQAYSQRGEFKWIYLCMRFTKVTDNLFYYYLMSDLDTTVIPNVRVFNPETALIPPDTDPTCDFCTFTTPPPDTEYNLLQRQGTSEILTTTPSLCLPCTTTEAMCHAQPTMTITTTAAPAQTENPVTSGQPPNTVVTTPTIAPIIQTPQVVNTDQTDNPSLTLLILSALSGVIQIGIMYRILDGLETILYD